MTKPITLKVGDEVRAKLTLWPLVKGRTYKVVGASPHNVHVIDLQGKVERRKKMIIHNVPRYRCVKVPG